MKMPPLKILLIVAILPGCAPAVRGPKAPLPLVIYDEGDNQKRPYIASGYTGNVKAMAMNRNWTDNPHSGKTCWRASYNAQGDWGEVMFQHPANNWGDRPGGWDLTGARKLTFWARGETGNEVVTFSYGGLTGRKYNDTSTKSLPNVHLSRAWTQYTIDVSDQNLNDVMTGFAWMVKPGRPTVFYLDDIRYE